MGVFYCGVDRPIGQNWSFLDSTAPTQRGNYVAVIILTSALQYSASLVYVSVQ